MLAGDSLTLLRVTHRAMPAGFQHKLKEGSIAWNPCRSFFPYPGFTDAQRAQPKRKGGGQSQTLHPRELVFATDPFHLVISAELLPEHPCAHPYFEAHKNHPASCCNSLTFRTSAGRSQTSCNSEVLPTKREVLIINSLRSVAS